MNTQTYGPYLPSQGSGQGTALNGLSFNSVLTDIWDGAKSAFKSITSTELAVYEASRIADVRRAESVADLKRTQELAGQDQYIAAGGFNIPVNQTTVIAAGILFGIGVLILTR